MKVRGNAPFQPKLTEEHVVLEIMQRLALAGVKVKRIKERIPEIRNGRKFWRGRGLMGSGASEAGISDLIGWVKTCVHDELEDISLPVFIEVKRPGGRRRPAQEAFIAEAKADGCIAFFADCWEDVVKGFGEHGIDISRKGGIEWQPSGK